MRISDYEEAIDELACFDIKEIRLRHKDVVYCVARLDDLIFVFDCKGRAWWIKDSKDYDDYLVAIYRNEKTNKIDRINVCNQTARRMPQLDLKFNN